MSRIAPAIGSRHTHGGPRLIVHVDTQLFPEELMRYGDGTQYRLAQLRRLSLLVGLFLLRVFDMYAVGFGDSFDGLLEVHALLFLVELDAVAPTVAAVAVP